jgi:hypothetical protein
MEQDHNNFLAQPEFLSFERRLMEVVHELNMKRVGVQAVSKANWFDARNSQSKEYSR